MADDDDPEKTVRTGVDGTTPESDLLDRYERMVQMQVETVNDVDEKAATTMRIVAVLLGVLLSLLTFLSNDRTIEITESTALPVFWVALGVAGLLLTLGSCLYTYLSSRTLFGPKAVLGDVLATHRVTTEDYQSHLLAGYATAIASNREVIRTNSRRFRNSLLLLVHGIVGVSTGLGLFIVGLSLKQDVIVSIAVFVPTAAFARHILTERYMVIPHEE